MQVLIIKNRIFILQGVILTESDRNLKIFTILLSRYLILKKIKWQILAEALASDKFIRQEICC